MEKRKEKGIDKKLKAKTAGDGGFLFQSKSIGIKSNHEVRGLIRSLRSQANPQLQRMEPNMSE